MVDHLGSQQIGRDTPRVDAYDKVTGRTRYVEDILMPGLLYARVLRCPHHRARLLSLETSAASRTPGVFRVVTAADIPGVNGFPEYSLGEPLLTPVGEILHMIGAPVALVVADTVKSARAGMDALQVDYEPLPPVLEIPVGGERFSTQAYKLQDHRVTHGDVQDVLASSEITLEARYITSYLEHAALESESVLGYLDENGVVTVMGGTHEPHWQQGWIADALAIPQDRVRFITPPVGGSFGGKQDPWPLVATGLLTYLTQRPVQLVYSRLESFEASPKRHPYQVHYRMGANLDGKLTGVQVRIDANTGGYDSAGIHIPEYAVTAAGGPYHWEAADLYAQTIYTNGPKSGQFRGFGTPQSTFALECCLDEMLQRLDEDPLSFRLKNKIHQSSTTFLGYPVAESLGYGEVLEALRPRYEEFLAHVREFNATSANAPIRAGVGLAGMWYRFGKRGSLRIEAHAELGLDGSIIVYCSAPEYGQGISTVMLQLAADTMGIPRGGIKLVNADTALTPDSDVQGASRATYWVGNAVCRAVQDLKAEVLGVAAEMLDCDPSTLSLNGKSVLGSSNRRVSLGDVAGEFEHMGKSRKVPGFFDLSPQFPEESRPKYTPHFVTGAHMAEVRVDMETGVVRVVRYVAVHDVGRVINPKGAEGQVEGAVVMGLGAALSEVYVPGVTTGFGDYILPMIGDIPEIEVVFVEVPGYHGPRGAKGLGETAMLPSTPAIINAVSRAIGVRIREIPATPERILAAVERSSDSPQ